MTDMGGLTTLLLGVFYTTLSMGLFLVLNIPWLALMVWLVFMMIYRSWVQFAARKKS